MVETRGRTGRKPGPADSKSAARKARLDRYSKPPTVRSALQRSSIAAIVFIAAMILIVHQTVAASIALGGFVLLFYVPLSYYTDLFFYRRRRRKTWSRGSPSRGRADVTVGACPGELLPDPPRGLRPRAARRPRRRGRAAAGGPCDELGVTPEAILLTHTHIDHIGAVAQIARATGAPVYCPRAD